MGWVSPTTTNDPNVKWTNDGNAIDGHKLSYANNNSGDWDEWLELGGIDIPKCSSFAIYAQDFAGIDNYDPNVRVEVYDGSDWVLAYTGNSITKLTWTIKSFTEQRVTAIRVKSLSSDRALHLMEVVLSTTNSAIPAPLPPLGATTRRRRRETSCLHSSRDRTTGSAARNRNRPPESRVDLQTQVQFVSWRGPNRYVLA